MKSINTRIFAESGKAAFLRPPAIFFILLCLLSGLAIAGDISIVNLRDPLVRRQRVEYLSGQSLERKGSAAAAARIWGRPIREQRGDDLFEVMAVEANRVYAYKTCNVNSAISIGADLIRNTAPYNLDGTGLTVGLWDGGGALVSHQEFDGRVAVLDSALNSNHTTHVCGTIAAAGVDPNALGMAPGVWVDSYEWTADLAEMTSRAMSYPDEPNTIQMSNHSYSYICGWEHSFATPRWYGTWGEGYRESDFFGVYSSEPSQWDGLCYSARYYLPFKSCGNDRNDPTPLEGEKFEYFYSFKWWKKAYNSATDPYADGWDNGGFDTITIVSGAKNIMSVGAVDDAVLAGVRDVNSAAMAIFSGWGPTDDGRIKPDIVTNGIGVYSCIASSDTSYASSSGTSMAAPAAAGSAALLAEYYNRLFPGGAMLASTLKGLLIHTADDLGRSGPDYCFGWGLLNLEAAAKQISDHNDLPGANKITEDIVDDVNTIISYSFEWDRRSPIRATLCWTDPPGTPTEELDNPTPRLVNDLDVVIIGPGGSGSYYPFILNPASPAAPATTGSNIRDNVEQVLISSPVYPGTYTVEVSYKGTLTGGEQEYSLIISGQAGGPLAAGDFNGDGAVDFNDLGRVALYWLDYDPMADIATGDGQGIINLLDFAAFAQDWD